MPSHSTTSSMTGNQGSARSTVSLNSYCASQSSARQSSRRNPSSGLSPAMTRFLDEPNSVSARISLGGRNYATRQ
ncbi:hypothetical protein V2G26_006339 [Clonostachys chloroleuca]